MSFIQFYGNHHLCKATGVTRALLFALMNIFKLIFSPAISTSTMTPVILYKCHVTCVLYASLIEYTSVDDQLTIMSQTLLVSSKEVSTRTPWWGAVGERLHGRCRVRSTLATRGPEQGRSLTLLRRRCEMHFCNWRRAASLLLR